MALKIVSGSKTCSDGEAWLISLQTISITDVFFTLYHGKCRTRYINCRENETPQKAGNLISLRHIIIPKL